MPIASLTSGDNFIRDYKNKINEIVDWINLREKARLTPSDKGRIVQFSGDIDITPLVREVEQIEQVIGGGGQ